MPHDYRRTARLQSGRPIRRDTRRSGGDAAECRHGHRSNRRLRGWNNVDERDLDDHAVVRRGTSRGRRVPHRLHAVYCGAPAGDDLDGSHVVLRTRAAFQRRLQIWFPARAGSNGGCASAFEFAYDSATGLGAEIFADRIVLHLTDGQLGDIDAVVNGQISDPIGLALVPRIGNDYVATDEDVPLTIDVLANDVLSAPGHRFLFPACGGIRDRESGRNVDLRTQPKLERHGPIRLYRFSMPAARFRRQRCLSR